MLDPIYHRTLKLFCYPISCVKNVKILPSFTQHHNGHHYVTLLNL